MSNIPFHIVDFFLKTDLKRLLAVVCQLHLSILARYGFQKCQCFLVSQLWGRPNYASVLLSIWFNTICRCRDKCAIDNRWPFSLWVVWEPQNGHRQFKSLSGRLMWGGSLREIYCWQCIEAFGVCCDYFPVLDSANKFPGPQYYRIIFGKHFASGHSLNGLVL